MDTHGFVGSAGPFDGLCLRCHRAFLSHTANPRAARAALVAAQNRTVSPFVQRARAGLLPAKALA